MFVSGVTNQTMNPATQPGSDVGRTRMATREASPGRMNQLIQLIDRFSPSDVSTGLLLAETTYLQSQAPPSVTAAMIATQLAGHHITAPIAANGYLSSVACGAGTGTQLNMSC